MAEYFTETSLLYTFGCVDHLTVTRSQGKANTSRRSNLFGNDGWKNRSGLLLTKKCEKMKLKHGYFVHYSNLDPPTAVVGFQSSADRLKRDASRYDRASIGAIGQELNR